MASSRGSTASFGFEAHLSPVRFPQTSPHGAGKRDSSTALSTTGQHPSSVKRRRPSPPDEHALACGGLGDEPAYPTVNQLAVDFTVQDVPGVDDAAIQDLVFNWSRHDRRRLEELSTVEAEVCSIK